MSSGKEAVGVPMLSADRMIGTVEMEVPSFGPRGCGSLGRLAVTLEVSVERMRVRMRACTAMMTHV